MQPSTPFVDPESGELDTDQIIDEAVPLAKLVALVGVAALVPFVLTLLFAEALALNSALAAVFSVATQFVLAVGSGLVLLYVVARGTQLVEE